jgi:hypothetical protein
VYERSPQLAGLLRGATTAVIFGLVVLAVLLAELAAARRSGADFEHVWPHALLTALAGSADLYERSLWRTALNSTRGDWKAAFEGEHPRPLAVAAAMVAA